MENNYKQENNPELSFVLATQELEKNKKYLSEYQILRS